MTKKASDKVTLVITFKGREDKTEMPRRLAEQVITSAKNRGSKSEYRIEETR